MPKNKKVDKKNANNSKRDKIKLGDKIEDFDLNLEGLKLEEGLETEESDMTNLDLKNLEFNQFMKLPSEQDEKGSVALERMALSAPRPIFVGGIPQTTNAISGEENTEEGKYMPSTNQSGEATYTGSTHVETDIENVDTSRLGRERREIGTTWDAAERFSAREDFGFNSGSLERTERMRRFDTSIAGTNKDKEEIKYQKYNPKKLQSGR
ncbi:MAG: hypothetical protein ABSG05_00450 [Candidatus Pacearchaeota archaeon]